MELYYKVSKESKTGKAFLAIIDRVKKFRKKAAIVCEKYGIREMYHIGWDLCGVYTCKFHSNPDRTDWKKVDDGYMPKVRSKNTKLLQDFAELKELSVKRSEIDCLLGLDNPFHQVGYEIFDDCIVFVTDDKNDIKHEDAQMISNVDFINMRK